MATNGNGTTRQFKKRFGKRLQKARHERGITQRQLAEQLQIATVTVSHYETGRALPSFLTLRELSILLQKPADYLLCRRGR